MKATCTPTTSRTVPPMDLIDTLRTTGAVREFTAEPVPDEVLARVLDTARFAPSGGNRQGWRVVVVRDPDTRRRIRDLYLDGWYQYLAMASAGLTPWGPLTDRDAEARAARAGRRHRRRPRPRAGRGSPSASTRCPSCSPCSPTCGALATVDRDLPRYAFAGGASIYPFAWNLLLAARAEGLGGVITTMRVRREDDVKALLGAPDELALAAVIALGHPVHQPRRLRRAPVADWAIVDRVDGAPFGS